MRVACVICESHNLVALYTLPGHPITPSSNNRTENTDIYADCRFVGCTDCGCVQLETLIDPVLLYGEAYNNTFDTPTWKAHHMGFADFIKSTFTGDSILEVGGSSGILYKMGHFSPEMNVTIMDICDNPKRDSTLKFVQGNCEEFDYSGYSCVVLSHTFEHLYSPRRFIERLQRGRVESVYISIPNMEHLYDTKNISILHNEHTYFIDTDTMISLFSQFNYSCKGVSKFKSHSTFFHFRYDTSILPLALPREMKYILSIPSIFREYEEKMANIDISGPCFICPGGHYGQKIYYYLKSRARNIVGFIDNDVTKQGKRVYGTKCITYAPSILSAYGGKSVQILLYAGPYTEELKAQLSNIYPLLKYIDI